MGASRFCKRCKYLATLKGETGFKTNTFCCHPEELRNGYGKPLMEKVKKCFKFSAK